jgi:DMSO/TMAO reductase YedYZ heme-binding membrane subunit
MNIVDNSKEKTLIVGGSLVLSIAVYAYISLHTQSANLRLVQLEEFYGFMSIILLFKAVIARPLYRVFPTLSFKALHYRCLGGLGISCFYFALLHGVIGFFGLLQGVQGLPFLTTKELVSITLGFLAILILSIMAATSWNWMMRKLGERWKVVHRFVYFAVTAIVVHVLLIGSHYGEFTNFYSIVPIMAFLATLLLYAASTRKHLFEKYPTTPQWQSTLLVAVIALSIIFSFYQLHVLITGAHH